MKFLATWIVGLILGALGLWIAANFIHIPYTKYSKNNSAVVTNGVNNTAVTNHTAVLRAARVNGFPNNVPVYSPSNLAFSTKSNHGSDAVIYSASYTTSQPSSSVVDFYKSNLASDGWRIDNQSQNGGITAIQASGHNEQLAVLVTPLAGQNGGGSNNTGFQLAVTPTH